jgi:hypothetical protein
MITNKYDYTPISRESVDGQRLYLTPDGTKVPSVTTILSKTKSKESMAGLQKWKDFVGEEKAQQVVTEAAGVGTAMHKKLEEHCLGTTKPPGSNLVQLVSHNMAQTIITNGLAHMNECWGVEVPLYVPGLYAGTTDCVGQWKNKDSIMDFKQTNKPKKVEYIEDYFLQLTAYGLAHDEVHGTKIRQGVVLMCVRPTNNDVNAVPQYQEFVIEGKEFEMWQDKWLARVEQYYLQFA